MRVGAGLLHYQFWPGVRVALDALFAQTRAPDLVIVLDNGSGDGSAAELARAYPQVQLAEVSQNRGPIGGKNLLLRHLLESDAEAFLLLNNDCKLAPDALQLMIERLEQDSRVGAIGPLIASLSEPDRLAMAGGVIDRRTWDTRSIDSPSTISEWRGRPPHRVDWLNGSALLLRADAARSVGPFYEEFFYYFDEADYLLRLASLGWGVECVPAAVAWEEPGSAPPYLVARNRLGLVLRTAPRRYLLREVVRIAWAAVRALVRPPYRGARADARARLRGLLDFIRNRWGPPP
jgi:N-acetylglucosaminyl-diphospho-decaprenol L-rhamnosyltransferase